MCVCVRVRGGGLPRHACTLAPFQKICTGDAGARGKHSCAVLVCCARVTVLPGAYKCQKDSILAGDALKTLGQGRDGMTHEQCEKACEAEADCKGYVTEATQYPGAEGVCGLHADTAGATARSGKAVCTKPGKYKRGRVCLRSAH